MDVSPIVVENQLHVLTCRTGQPAYDFDFELYFACNHPVALSTPQPAVARVGALAEYGKTYSEYAARSLQLINHPEQHDRASLISHWYPVLEDLTPRTTVWDDLPSADEVTKLFEWPVFVKGERQTSRHQAALSIIRSPGDFDRCMQDYAADPILNWQKLAVREFVPLRPIKGTAGNRVPPSFEFRSFWWHGINVGIGRYWSDAPTYEASDAELRDALEIAGEAARRVNVPFLVVDVAMDAEGRWLVIECNDGQESGYAGVEPLKLWRKILKLLER
ncbi:MAG: ATP-grasp domain-containing protein [Planctomycetes bacterium]|nr:ATP-grasp domain-containing protein [Planctomycetota bacterium]